MSEKNQFEKFIEAFKKAHPDDSKLRNQKLAIKQWNKIKQDFSTDLLLFQKEVGNKMQEFRNKEAQINAKKSQMWEKFRKAEPKALPQEEKKPQSAPNEQIRESNLESDFKKIYYGFLMIKNSKRLFL